MADKKAVWAYVSYLRKFRDISKAVQLVAIAKLRKMHVAIESRGYALYLSAEMFDGARDYNPVHNTIVVITSERSCSGKSNSEVLSASKEAIGICVSENRVVRIISIG